MKVSVISAILAFTGASVADFWAGFENLPDGPYAGKNHPDGSVTVSAAIMDDSAPNGFTLGQNYTFELVRDDSQADAKRVVKRGGDVGICWGGTLDAGSTDSSAIKLKNWAGGGRDFHGHDWYGYNVGGVYVYYCVLNDSWTNVDRDDISYGMGVMDQYCAPYERGYMYWGGNPVEIVGKCRTGEQICVSP